MQSKSETRKAEDVGITSGQTTEPVAAASEATPSPGQDPHQEWPVVPYVPPPPPELEILPGGVPPTEFVEQVLTWGASGLPYRHVIEAAKNFWGIRYDEEFPLLHLVVLLVLGTRFYFYFYFYFYYFYFYYYYYYFYFYYFYFYYYYYYYY